MSVSVKIRTDKEITPDNIFDKLLSYGGRIIITSKDFPYVKFGCFYESVRGIEVNKEDDGLEVRVCIFASEEDYHLFALTIKAIMELSGGRAFLEDCDDEEVTDPFETFNDEWIAEEMKNGIDCCKTLTQNSGDTVIMDGLFMQMCIGPLFYEDMGLRSTGSTHRIYVKAIQEYLAKIQWEFKNKTDTSSRLAIQSDNGSATQSVSLITIKDGEVRDFDYISWSKLVGIMDLDNGESVLFPIEHLWKVLNPEKFNRIDDYQYERDGDLTVEDIHEMMDRAKYFVPDDVFFEPSFPGEGENGVQQTFILTWNPETSSLSTRENNECIRTMLVSPARYWEVKDFEQVRMGDKFYIVKCGKSNTGIYQCGIIDSNPYPRIEKDGSVHYYVDLKTTVHINFNEVKILSTKELTKQIPEVDWKDETSGRLLSAESSSKLEALWAQYLIAHESDVDRNKKMNRIKKM